MIALGISRYDFSPRYDPDEKFVWWPIKLSGICMGVAHLYVCIYVCACGKRVTSSHAVYVNETVERRMNYRYYFYRSADNFAARHAISFYWRKIRGKWRKMHFQKVLSRKLNISDEQTEKTNNDPKENRYTLIYVIYSWKRCVKPIVAFYYCLFSQCRSNSYYAFREYFITIHISTFR